ncbi:hypothetical protein B0H19DRAFT_1114520 [Mycena capillaripes]|nr:hypothetical protein B0H19DRAFT_1114520 [Mycena capillaripes]
MFSKMISAVLLTALAGRVLAQTPSQPPFNITVGGNLFLAIDALNFTKEPSFSTVPSLSQCNDKCGLAQTPIAACAVANASDTPCFCNVAVTKPLQDCQECLFTALITVNKPAPEVRVGSNPFLGAWTTNCVNITNADGSAVALAVTVPPTWDGPFVAVFPDAIGWVLAVTGGILGSSLIFMLCNM